MSHSEFVTGIEGGREEKSIIRVFYDTMKENFLLENDFLTRARPSFLLINLALGRST